MGGKTATTTQQVQIPPEVMARYNAVNTRAESAASQPFKAYSQDPSAFVAPMTQTQQTAMQNINQATGMSQPYTNAAAGLMMSGAQGVGPLTQQQIQNYQNPYTQSVVDATMAGLRQQQGQALSQQQGEAIRAGAFGGDRAGLQRAQLMGQQGLATAQAISPLYQRAYEQAVQTAAGQQGVQAQDYQRMLAAGQQLGGLGAQAQRSAIEGAQAQFGMGTAEQQTEQAGKSALYNQFLQERGYDFQTAQFLANIAMGTGALSGSTTTTAQPIPFMSDEREKTNIQPLGKGLYAYDYKDDVRRAEEEGRPMPPKRVGPMAQDIEERAPGLVGEVNGHKVVKGLSPESMGGAVVDLGPGEYRENYAQGGGLAGLYAQFGSPYGPQQGITDGPYGGRAGYLKAGLSPPRDIAFKADTRQVKPISTIMQEASRGAEQASNFANMFDPEKSPLAKGAQKGFGALQSAYQSATRPAGPTIDETSLTAQGLTDPSDPFRLPGARARGGLVGYAEGGGVDEDKSPVDAYDTPGAGLGIPTEMRQYKMMEPGKPPGAPKSIMSDITDAAKVAASIYAMSDERMKSGMQQVGELYNGLPVYKYRLGDGPPQIGLSAQEARGLHPEAVMEGKDGLLRLNYDRATRAYGGGLVPREGYQAGGMPDDEYAIRTIAAEASGRSPEEARAIARVLENRRASGRWGDTYRDVVTARNQFEPWNDPAGRNYPANIPSNDPRLSMARAAYESRLDGEDPTGGALHFWAPGAQKALGRAAPSWDTDDATMIGSTRFVRGVDGRRPAGLTAYAGQPEQSAATRAIDTAAGTPTGLGGAGTPPREERGLLASMLPAKFGTKTQANPKGEQFGGVGEFLTSRQFIQPLFEGLAGMASSPSLFAGPAVLQGLGAASRAYTGLEKEMAGTAESAERAKLTEAQTNMAQVQAQGATLKDFQGVQYILVRDKSGRPQWVNFQLEYQPNKDRYQFYVPAPGEVVPSGPGEPRRGDLERRDQAAPQKPGEVQAGRAEGEAAAPPPAPTRGTDPFAITSDLKERALAEGRRMSGEPDATLQNRKDLIEEQNRLAQGSSDQKKLLLEIGVLGSTPGGFVSQGALQPYKMRLAKVANDVVGTIFPADPSGKPSEIFSSSDLARYEAWEKKLSELSAVAARTGNQTAVESLNVLRTMYPTPEQSPAGFAKNAAELLIQRQQDIDRAYFLNQYHDVLRGQTTRSSSRFDPSIRQEFDKRYEDIYVRDREALQRMLNSSSGPTDPRTQKRMTDADGKPMSWFTFLQKNASRLEPEFVKQIEKRFNAPGVMRYFQVGGG